MELTVTGTNIAISDQVRSYVERKIGKLDKHFPRIIEIKVEFSEEKTKSPDSRILIRVNVIGGGASFHAEDRADEQLKAIDKVSEVLARQLERYKGKVYSKKMRSAAAKAAALAEPPPEPDRKVVKVKSFLIKPFRVQEAIDEMEALGHDFFLFADADTEELKLVYKRKDGNFGLIEPRTE